MQTTKPEPAREAALDQALAEGAEAIQASTSVIDAIRRKIARAAKDLDAMAPERYFPMADFVRDRDDSWD